MHSSNDATYVFLLKVINILRGTFQIGKWISSRLYVSGHPGEQKLTRKKFKNVCCNNGFCLITILGDWIHFLNGDRICRYIWSVNIISGIDNTNLQPFTKLWNMTIRSRPNGCIRKPLFKFWNGSALHCTQPHKDATTHPYNNLSLSLPIKGETRMPSWHLLLWHSKYRSSYTEAPAYNIVHINRHWD